MLHPIYTSGNDNRIAFVEELGFQLKGVKIHLDVVYFQINTTNNESTYIIIPNHFPSLNIEMNDQSKLKQKIRQ